MRRVHVIVCCSATLPEHTSSTQAYEQYDDESPVFAVAGVGMTQVPHSTSPGNQATICRPDDLAIT